MKDKVSLAVMACILVLPAIYIFASTLLNFSLGMWLQRIDLP